MVPGAAALFVVGLAAAGLGEAAAEQVTDGQDDDVQPRPVGPEIVPVVCSAADGTRGDQDGGNGRRIDPKLRRFER